MKTFKDKDGCPWDIELTVGDIARLKKDSDEHFNLFEPKSKVGSRELQDVLQDDDLVFFEMICQLLEPQILEKEKTIPQFGKLVAGDCWPLVRKAFFEEWCDFFRSLQRPDKALPLEKWLAYQEVALELVMAKTKDKRLATLDLQVRETMESALNESFSSSLDSLDSTLSGIRGDKSKSAPKASGADS